MKTTTQKDLILSIWDLQEKWRKLNDPQFNWYGNMTFKRLNMIEMAESVRISDNEKQVRKLLRKEIGLWNYIKFCISPLRFYKNNILKNNN